MKKTSILSLLMLAFCTFAKAQTITFSIPQIYDGMDSITIHYNPFGSGGNATDTMFQTYTGALFAYIYTTDSVSGTGGGNHYADGGWTTIDTMASATFTRNSATDWTVTMPSMRQFLQYVGGAYNGTGVPSGTYITGLNVIVHDSGATIVQGANGYASVLESYTLQGDGQPLSTGPVTNIPAHTFISDGNENVVVYYHPQQDTFTTQVGDVQFRHYNDSTLYTWAWAVGSDGVSYDFTPGASWTAVPTTPEDAMVEIDSNNYAWDIRNLRGDFMNIGMPSGTSIDSIGFIPRNAAGSVQTINLYVPLVVSTSGVANVNLNSAAASIYPNPATDAIFLSYSFAQPAAAKLIISNLMGQTVMTQDLGSNQVGNMYLSVSNLPSGVYMATVTNGTSKIVKQFVKN